MTNVIGRPGTEFGIDQMFGKVVVIAEGADILNYDGSSTGEKLEAGIELKLGICFTGVFNGEGKHPSGEGFCLREFNTADGLSGWVNQAQLIEVEPPDFFIEEDPGVMTDLEWQEE